MYILFQNPAFADVYTEHSTRVRVAKYAPSGFYICSGGKSATKKLLLIIDREAREIIRLVASVRLSVCVFFVTLSCLICLTFDLDFFP